MITGELKNKVNKIWEIFVLYDINGNFLISFLLEQNRYI